MALEGSEAVEAVVGEVEFDADERPEEDEFGGAINEEDPS